MAASLGEAVLHLRADLRGLRSDMMQAQNLIRTTLNSASRMGGILGGAFSALGGAAAGVYLISRGLNLAVSAASNVASGFYGIGAAITAANDDLQRMRMSLGVVLKSQSLADQLIADVREFAAETPFNTQGLMQQFLLLRNYGIETRKILPMLKAIGDAGAASPRGMEFTVHRIALAIGQMKTQGKLLGGELKQLAEAGIPATEILKTHFRMSIQEIQKAVKSGSVSIDDVIDALVKGMDSRFGGTMKRQSQMWSGLWERMRDKGQIALQQVTEPLFELMRGGLKTFVDMFDSKGFMAFVQSARSGLQSLVTVAERISKSLAPIGSVMVASFERLRPLIAEISTSFKSLFAGAGGSLFAGLTVSVQATVAVIRQLTTWVRGLLDVVSLLATDWSKAWEVMRLLVSAVVLDIDAEFTFLWDSMVIGLKNAVNMMQNIFAAFGVYVGSQMGIVASAIEMVFAALAKLKSAKLTELPQALEQFRSDMLAMEGAMNRKQGAAAGKLITDLASPTQGNLPGPQRGAGGQSLRDRAQGLLRELFESRKNRQRRELGERNQGLLNQGAQAAGGMAAQFGGLVSQGITAAVQGLGATLGQQQVEKKAKAEFVGISELSRKIQENLFNEKKEEKQVRAINVVGRAVNAVEGAVHGVKDAIKGWIPRAT